ITLLFAFFVVMFAASNSDQKKVGQIAQAVQVAFREMAIFTPSGKMVPLYDEGGLPSNTKEFIGNTHSAFDNTQLAARKPSMNKIREELEGQLKDELAGHTVHLSEDSRGLTISLAEAGFFDPGSAVMPPKALEVVDRI